MIKAIYYSGLTSTTLSGTLLVLIAALLARSRKRSNTDANPIPVAVARLLDSRGFLAFLLLGTLFNTGYGVYKGYVVPRDYMQDVISAEEFLSGRSLYPDDMTQKFIESIHRNPPTVSLWPEASENRRDEKKARAEAAASPWVQAHPPFMTLFFSPLVRLFGTYGTYFAISLLSISSLIAAPCLIARTLGLTLSNVALGSLSLAVLGWAATIEDLRDGQSGPYLLLLCILGWSALRSGRPWLAGLAVGIAASLKLYPGIVLVYFLLKDRRAFASGMLTVVAGLSLSCLLCGPESLFEYAKTARFVSGFYSSYSSNISLLACVQRILGDTETQVIARAVWFAFAAGSLTLAFLASRLPRTEAVDESRSIDLGYSFFLSLGVLLTPVAWDHYAIMLSPALAVLGHRELRRSAPEGSTMAYLVLVAIMATPFGTFAFARSSMSGLVDDYVLRVTLLSIRTISILVLAGWLAWTYAREHGLARSLVPIRRGFPSPEVDES